MSQENSNTAKKTATEQLTLQHMIELREIFLNYESLACDKVCT